MHLPEDPFILLSYINTQLRDFYPFPRRAAEIPGRRRPDDRT